MRSIAIINQKGGVGKTTTTVNLGAALVRLGFRVLLIDLDAQANLTIHLNIDPTDAERSVYDVLSNRSEIGDVVQRRGGMDVVPSHIDLAGAEVELVGVVGRETILRDKVQAYVRGRPDDPTTKPGYDFVLIDCPPSLGLLSLNALTFVEEVIIPMQTEYFALQGMTKLMDVVELVRSRLNVALKISAIVPCRYDPRTNLAKEVLQEMHDYFGELVTQTRVRANVRLAEAPSHGQTVFDYAPDSKGAADYLALACELTGRSYDDAMAALRVTIAAAAAAARAEEAGAKAAPFGRSEPADEEADAEHDAANTATESTDAVSESAESTNEPPAVTSDPPMPSGPPPVDVSTRPNAGPTLPDTPAVSHEVAPTTPPMTPPAAPVTPEGAPETVDIPAADTPAVEVSTADGSPVAPATTPMSSEPAPPAPHAVPHSADAAPHRAEAVSPHADAESPRTDAVSPGAVSPGAGAVSHSSDAAGARSTEPAQRADDERATDERPAVPVGPMTPPPPPPAPVPSNGMTGIPAPRAGLGPQGPAVPPAPAPIPAPSPAPARPVAGRPGGFDAGHAREAGPNVDRDRRPDSDTVDG